jgi:glycosyltransferase involved in cell wall biosynthesis
MRNYSGVVVIPTLNEQETIPKTLNGLWQQATIQETQQAVVVVDNGSSDDTLGVIESLRAHASMFDLHIVSEPLRGIGAACATGFTYALEELKAPVIARLDADTVPTSLWFSSLLNRHARQPSIALLGGPVEPGLEGEMRRFDQLIIPTAKFFGKIIKSIRYRESGMMRFVSGHNMSTSALAYKEVGGFSLSSTITDDVDYNLRVLEAFGKDGIGHEHGMRVYTSQRRIRSLGYIGAARYYLNDSTQTQSQTVAN